MSFFAELKRRNVFRVGIAYAVTAWLLIQVSDILLESIGAPPWVMLAMFIVLAAGFVIALFFAWAFELTPEGIKKEKEVDRSQSIAPQTGKKLNNTILILMALAIAYLLFDKFSVPAQPGSEPFSQKAAGQSAQGEEKRALAPIEAITQAEAEPVISRQSIAVLPFANRSNEQEDLFFTDGIHDDLLTQLAKINGLKVISRTSVMEYRDTTKKIKEIATELGVSKILEGGIQRAGKRIRINAQLIDVATDEHLWAETYDREMTVENIFDIQSEITRHIVKAVRGEMTDEETNTLTQQPTDNLEAYEDYLKAKALLNDPLYSPEKYINAEVWLKKAVAADPEFVLAWGLLVTTNAQAVWQGYDESPERFQAVLDALGKAEKYGPDLPETVAAKAEYLYRIKNDFHAAEPLFAQASQAKPGDPELLSSLATTERRTGNFERAITHYQMAIELDPANLDTRTTLLSTLATIGEYERAGPLADLWIEKYPETQTFRTIKAQLLLFGQGEVEKVKALLTGLVPNTGGAYTSVARAVLLYERDFQGLIDFWNLPLYASLLEFESYRSWILASLASAYHHLGDTGNAEKYAQEAIEFGRVYQSASAINQAFNLEYLALAYALTGQFEKALASANDAVHLVPESADRLDGPRYSINRAMLLGMAGQRDESLAEIERLLNTPAGLSRWELYLSPEWDFFRDDERFNELARPLNLKESQ